MAEKIPSPEGMGRSIIDHDPRNRDYPARGVLFGATDPIRTRSHRRGLAYDQGTTSQCVAYTAKGMLNTAPFSKAVDYDIRRRYSTDDLYLGAQQRDEWPGEDYDGTSGLGVLRYLMEKKVVTEYRWCFGLDDVLRTLSHHGPVAVGTWWTRDMFEPDNNGLVTYTGQKVGGHQYEATGVDVANEEVIFTNSWGLSWGQRGRFRMKFDQFEKALLDQGDAHTFITVTANQRIS